MSDEIHSIGFTKEEESPFFSSFISVLVVNIDYVLVKSAINDNFQPLHKGYTNHMEPVIRVFGSTPLGQRACVHIHGVRSLTLNSLVSSNPVL